VDFCDGLRAGLERRCTGFRVLIAAGVLPLSPAGELHGLRPYVVARNGCISPRLGRCTKAYESGGGFEHLY